MDKAQALIRLYQTCFYACMAVTILGLVCAVFFFFKFDIRTIIGKFDYKAIVFDPYPLLLAISDGVSGENDDFNKLLFSSTISNNLIDKIKNLFKQAFKDTFEQIMSDSAGTEIVLTFVVSGVVDAYRAWYLSDRVIGLKQVAHELAEVISKGLGDVIKEA